MGYRSIKTEILYRFAFVVSVILLLFSVSLYWIFNNSVNSSIKFRLYTKAVSIKHRLKESKKIDDLFYPYDGALLKNKKIVYKTNGFNIKDIDTKKGFYIIDYGEKISGVLVMGIDKPFAGELVLLQRGIDDKVEDLVDTMLWLEPLLFLILLFVANNLIDKILIPVKNITKIANKITVNNLLSTIKEPKGNNESRELVNSFNTMIKRVQEGVEKIERFNNDVSHELKTPLTVIKAEVELALQKPRKTKEYIDSLNSIKNEIDNIQKITDGLLLLTRYSKNSIKRSFVISSLDTLLLDTIKKYNSAIKSKNISIDIKQLEPISKSVNPLLIESLFSNLLDNAIKYTPKTER